MKNKVSQLKKKYYAMIIPAVVMMAGMIAMMPFSFTPKAEAQTISTNTRNLAGLIAVDRITGENGGSSDTSLGDLIVLGNLFGSNTTTNTRDLAGLIAVDRITGDDGGSLGESDETSLGDLIVLNGLFTSGTTNISSLQNRNLAALIAVDRITGDGSSGDESLADLIVLNDLFDP